MDEDIKDAWDIDLERLKVQAIRDNTAVLVDIAANFNSMCDYLEEINNHIREIEEDVNWPSLKRRK